MSLFRAGLLAKRRPSGAHGWLSWWTMPATRPQCVVLPMLLVVILVKGSEDATSHSHAQYHVAAGVWISLPVPDLYPLSSSSDFTGTKWALQDLALWRTNPSSLWHRQSLWTSWLPERFPSVGQALPFLFLGGQVRVELACLELSWVVQSTDSLLPRKCFNLKWQMCSSLGINLQ